MAVPKRRTSEKTTPVVLKHLAKEYDLEPYGLRATLRDKFGKRKNKRWEWQEGDPELKEIRKFLDGRSKSSEKSATN